MRTAILSIILALVPAISFSAGESEPGNPAVTPAVKPAERPRAAEPQSPAAQNPRAQESPASQESPAAQGVATPPTGPADPIKSAKPNALGETIVGGAAIDTKTYVIGPEDVLAVTVWREPDLSRPVIVRPDGKISLPIISELTAAGLTPEQLAGSITQALKKNIRNPEVSVSVQQVNSKRYYIQGEVNKPGPYPLVIPTTVLEGLGNAGGFKDFANEKKIVILRGTERLKFNYKEVTHGKHMDQNILLQPGDQIIVP